MRIFLTTDIAEFHAEAETFLLRDPLRHTVITGAVANAAEPMHLLSVRSGGEVVGVAMRAPGYHIYLGQLPPASVPAVAEALIDAVPDSDGVEGTTDLATLFAQRWCALSGQQYHWSYAHLLYRLGDLRIPPVAGNPRPATDIDTELCSDWIDAMRAETGMPPPALTPERIRHRIAAGSWWLWEHGGQPVSFAAHQLPTQGWSRIGPVYTPPDARGHGYASALTAHIGRMLRDGDIEVCLFADVANPTSNKIYRAIGFEPTYEFVRYGFSPTAALSSTS
ncbi:GNAT family N-acetyltransferase [Nocardia arthritidis]|uniref:GNAT family N-acetyltransferase n=1 Tax=Nocardia arthritidis TaxID=228602 RepID=A0A6G9YQ97_9NOCA|nr:GNAT family N-acetyltransferase [Nocardia arthritidis]QIS15290.1 GNAT family N-acetyltransferase [Nocardia arthritidis]